MPKIIQPKAIKGSQHWLQELVNHRPDLLADALRPKLGLSRDDIITWLSPLKASNHAEHQDEDFLEQLSIHLENRPLRSFWPSGGAVWDGLGKTSRGDVILIEAKAHIKELTSQARAKSPSSIKLIQQSLDETKRFFGADPSADWSQRYYQYANRLAHFYLLRHLNGIPAWLIFLYFINDNEMAGPKSVEAWRSAIEGVHAHLDIKPDKLGPYVVDVFFDVAEFSQIK
ncbi:MAG: hypothetical protein NT002_08370 [candidate division Zixibacteria bacterium]|nr:hypothetical protein [candidate division Zixibacteria bacterium]